MNVHRGRRRIAAWAALGLALCFGQVRASLRLQLDEARLSSSQIAISRSLLQTAQSKLPPTMLAALDRPIPVRWSDSLGEGVSGHASRRELLLDRALLAALETDADDKAHALALATVLHELAHFFDRAAPGGSMSRDPRLLDLAGWQVRATQLGTRIAGRRHDNRFVDRSPDPYELTDPAEFVAVNLEHYLLDRSYACRRPALYRYFSDRLSLATGANATADCMGDFVYVDAGDGDEAALASLDPERVYQVDYLLAEGNERAMSRWGHSMLRLVVCAPGRPRGPDCRLDLAYHRVLSFRAFVGDLQVSSWRGLTGRYPSRLFVLPLTQVVDEYTKVELRGLRSVPLQLDRAEIGGLLERAAQLHWSYDGRYYFLSNNCAVETYKLLHDGVPRLADDRLGSITPNGVLQRLQRAGVADGSVLDDPREALRLGYRFDSLRPHYQQLYAVAQEQLQLPQASVEDWMALTPAQRRPWLQRADLRSGAALLLLEQAAQRRQRLQVQDELKRRYLSSGESGSDVATAVQRMLQQGAYLGRPAQLLDGSGYGLPQSSEREALVARTGEQRSQLQRSQAELEHLARGLMTPPQRELLDGIAENSDLLGKRLRALHAAEGGVRLP